MVTTGRDLRNTKGPKRMLRHGSAAGVRMISNAAVQYTRCTRTLNSKRMFAECVHMIVVTHAKRIQQYPRAFITPRVDMVT